MCWSPTADAVAGGVVASIGVVTLVGARRGRDRVLGALPLVLGAHQLVESVVWLDTQGRVSPGVGRWRLTACLAVGIVVTALFGADVAGRQVTARADGHVLDYGLGQGVGLLLIGGYLLATLGAPLLSPDRFVRWFGISALVGAAGCAAAWRLEFASTWCAYAAVLSLMLLAWVRRAEPGGAGSGGPGGGSGGSAQPSRPAADAHAV